MSRGLGFWERAILGMINKQNKEKEYDRHPLKDKADAWDIEHGLPPDRPCVYLFPWLLCTSNLECWTADKTKFIAPTDSELESARRAMHSFVRKFPQYGLIAGKGRAGGLYLYERDDPASAMWAKLNSEYKNFVGKNDARKAVRHLNERRNEPFSMFNRDRVTAPVYAYGGTLINPEPGCGLKKQRRRKKVFSDLSLPA
jgi:hypothetical protein